MWSLWSNLKVLSPQSLYYFTLSANCMHAGGGPQIQIDPGLLVVFQRCFLDNLVLFSGNQEAIRWRIEDNPFSRCEPTVWLDVPKQIPSLVGFGLDSACRRLLYIIVHNNVGLSGGVLRHIY